MIVLLLIANMSVDKSIRKNYIYNLTYQILVLITPLITTPYLARVLTPEGIGTYSFADSIVRYFSLFTEMGIGFYGQREISYHQDNRKERSRIFWELKTLSLINAFIFIGSYLVFVSVYIKENRLLYFILSTGILTIPLDVSWVLIGMEEFRTIVVRNIIIRLLDIAFIFVFIKDKGDLALHVFGVYFFMSAGCVYLWRELPRYIDKPNIKELRPFRNIKIIWSMFIPNIAASIYASLDKTMLGIFTQGAVENGYYEQCMRITRITFMLVTSLGSVMIPRVSYLFSKNEYAKIQLYMYRSYRFVLFLAISSCLGLVAISENLVPWFFGAGYEKVSGLLKLSSFLFIPIGISSVTGVQYLIPTKRQNIYTLTVISGVALNCVLNIFLIRFLLSYGAVIASVGAEIFIACLQLYIIRREISFMKIILSGRNYYIAGLVMFAVLEYVNKYLMPSALNTFIMIITGGIVYSLALIILRDEFFSDSITRFYNYIVPKK